MTSEKDLYYQQENPNTVIEGECGEVLEVGYNYVDEATDKPYPVFLSITDTEDWGGESVTAGLSLEGAKRLRDVLNEILGAGK